MPSSARFSLGDIEDRIRRRFGLAGAIESSLKPELSMSLDAGSIYAPGLSTTKGRRWAIVANTAALGTFAYWQILPSVDVVVTNIDFYAVATAAVVTWSIGATVQGTTLRNAIWMEHPFSDNVADQPSIFDSQWFAGVAPAGRNFWGHRVTDTQWEGELLLRAGTNMNALASAATPGMTANVRGYIANIGPVGS